MTMDLNSKTLRLVPSLVDGLSRLKGLKSFKGLRI
jgi:hypothetical protein